MNARQVIIRPVISEKSYALLAANKYTFRVHEGANKTLVPTSAIDLVPSIMSPAEMSMSCDIRLKTPLLDASLITGAIAVPIVVPLPVVKITAGAPAATRPGVDS